VDVIVVGGGPGGYAAAIHAAQRGDRVTLVEAREVGGTCLNRGCIPTKAMVEAARLLRDARRAAEFGVRVGEVALDYPALLARRDRVVAGLVGGLSQLLRASGVSVVAGRARLVPGPAVEVGGQRLAADAIVLAPGSVPARVPLPGADLPGVVDSDGLLALPERPASLCIIGGGVIGCEFAAIYAALGTRVTVVELLPRLLPPADEEVSRRLSAAFRRQGIAVQTGVRVAGVAPGPRVAWEGGETEAEVVLVAVGRRPNTEGLGCEAVGVALERGAIAVDARLRTTAPGIWAVGDATGGAMLAHAAFAQARAAVADMHGEPALWEGLLVPNPVFTHPEVAWAGLTEQEAAARGIAVTVGRFPFAALGRAQVLGETDGFLKLVAAAGTGRILGVHAFGPSATDLVAEGVLAAQAGLTAEDLEGTVHGHPTLSEGLGEAAAMALGRPLHAMRR
jgi:dihydrolipoamide dehydrogenase